MAMRPLARAVILGTVAFALAACGSSADSGPRSDGDGPDTLVFGAVPSEESQGLQQVYSTVIELLEKETGKKVEFKNLTDYAAIIEGMRAGKIDIAVYGPFGYITAKDSGVKVTPVAAVVDAPGETPGYRAYGIAKSGSDITSLADFKGKKVCFVDPTSTSGYLYPSAGLLAEDIDPVKDVEPIMAGGHDASALAVKSGQCDAGFAFDSMVDQTLIESGQLKKGDLEVVWESEIIAGSPIVISSDLPEKLKDTMIEALQKKANKPYLVEHGFCSSEDECPMQEESEYGYVAVDDAFFDGVRKVCATTNAAACNS